jgi:hypothetical protein
MKIEQHGKARYSLDLMFVRLVSAPDRQRLAKRGGTAAGCHNYGALSSSNWTEGFFYFQDKQAGGMQWVCQNDTGQGTLSPISRDSGKKMEHINSI